MWTDIPEALTERPALLDVREEEGIWKLSSLMLREGGGREDEGRREGRRMKGGRREGGREGGRREGGRRKKKAEEMSVGLSTWRSDQLSLTWSVSTTPPPRVCGHLLKCLGWRE